ncbi:MAG: class I SAM-dependent methyltransferase [Caldilineaceae bacterium]|nr:class I SAM-dependent methyltransferase [Caldilineaceae bacterium]
MENSQAYGPGFAQVYNRRWTGFAQRIAPFLFDFYTRTPVAHTHQTVLDLCCGTGQIARYFLERGYQVVGLDLSAPMLALAQENTQPYLDSGQVRFVQADATDFSLDEQFGLVLATFDALNHLPDLPALRQCFACVAAVCAGYFIFDLNTRIGLRRWNNIEVDDRDEDMTIVNHGIYDVSSERAWMKVTGFIRNAAGLYERFEQTAYNTLFAMHEVRAALLETGWQTVYFARFQDLTTPLADPETEARVFVVAHQQPVPVR